MVNFLSDGPTHFNVLWRDKKRNVGPRAFYTCSTNLRLLNNIATEYSTVVEML